MKLVAFTVGPAGARTEAGPGDRGSKPPCKAGSPSPWGSHLALSSPGPGLQGQSPPEHGVHVLGTDRVRQRPAKQVQPALTAAAGRLLRRILQGRARPARAVGRAGCSRGPERLALSLCSSGAVPPSWDSSLDPLRSEYWVPHPPVIPPPTAGQSLVTHIPGHPALSVSCLRANRKCGGAVHCSQAPSKSEHVRCMGVAGDSCGPGPLTPVLCSPAASSPSHSQPTLSSHPCHRHSTVGVPRARGWGWPGVRAQRGLSCGTCVDGKLPWRQIPAS